MPAEVTKVREVNKLVVINKLYGGKASFRFCFPVVTVTGNTNNICIL